MLVIMVLLLLLLIFDFVALRFGYDSRDGPDSQEWERRRQHGWRIM